MARPRGGGSVRRIDKVEGERSLVSGDCARMKRYTRSEEEQYGSESIMCAS